MSAHDNFINLVSIILPVNVPISIIIPYILHIVVVTMFLRKTETGSMVNQSLV
jgi:ABC-type uncharacterized transport system permease subunit